jgi:hypothetical protein
MPDLSGPWHVDNPEDGWSQSQWYRDAYARAASGVYGLPAPSVAAGDLGLSVSGLSVSMGLGRAHVRGAGYERATTPWTGASEAGDGLPRVDRLVLRRDLTVPTVVPVLIPGTPAQNPTAKPPVQDEATVWDLPLFRWTVAAGAQTITDVRDERRWLGVTGFPVGPSISGTFTRSDGQNVLNANAYTDLKAVPSVTMGVWRDYNPGDGVGFQNDLPGRYRITVLGLTAVGSDRYEEIVVGGTADRSVCANSCNSGYGGPGYGTVDIDAPSGLAFRFRAYNSGVAGSLRTGHRWAVEWLRPL